MAAGLLGVGLLACTRTLPEQALRRDVVALQAAIEARDAGAVADALDPAFVGPEGMDATTARRLAVVQFMQNRAVGVRLGPLDVRMHGERAEVGVTAVLTGGGGGLLPNRAQAWRLHSVWQQQDGHWRVLRLAWQPALAADDAVGQGNP